jgi:lysophospholipase
MVIKSLRHVSAFMVLTRPMVSVAQSSQGPDPYAPVYVDCPSGLSVRDASNGLSDSEQSWRDSRSEQVIPALRSYLEAADISGLDVQEYVQKLNSSSAPVVGLSISGGGTQSGIGGLGIWQAFDARYQPAVEARTGGLVQILTYLTGLSGGGAVSVALIAANNYSTTDDIRQSANFSTRYDSGRTGNQSGFYQTIFENAGAKAEAGFPVSVADPFGQFWGTWLPEEQIFANYSDIARENSDGGNVSAFALGAAPMPIMVLSEVVPGQSPEIGRIMFPGRNSTNGFNLTSYEVNPYEFGSWLGGRVQAFFPTRYLGTNMSDGMTMNNSQCVQGFDKLTFISGSTTDAYDAYLIDDFYKIPVFAKRSTGLEDRQSSSSDAPNDIPIPKDQEQNPIVEIVNQTASNFDQTFNESLWATYPNPFANYNDEMRGVDELLLLDGSMTGETNPIRPLIIPDRHVDFIIVYEASSDAKYGWVNGTNLISPSTNILSPPSSVKA